MEECREYLPGGWTEVIERDPVLLEIFDAHEYDLEQEAVPPFLIQELRGGNLERLRPLLALYGQPGLEMLRGLLEIDGASRDTAQVRSPDGQVAYAGYFFARPEFDKQAAAAAAKRYIAAIHQIYERMGRPAPIVAAPELEFLTGQEGRDFKEWWHHDFTHRGHPDVYSGMNDWFDALEYHENCRELADVLSEALYHISCDFTLCSYLQWPLLDTGQENPFQGYFDLWKMGLTIYFPSRDRAVLVQ